MWALREVSAVIALFVVLVCGQTIAAREQRIADTDEPVAVTFVQKKVSTSPIGRCSTTGTSANVRIQSIKSKTTSFSRVLMNMTTIETSASKWGNGTAKHIGICAEMADKGGFKGFSFTGGLCKMFSPGIQVCRCKAGSGDPIYVRDSFWDKQDRVAPVVTPVDGELMAYAQFPGTVVEQKLDRNFLNIVILGPLLNIPDAELASSMSQLLPGNTAFLCNGTDKCYTPFNLDNKHCSVGCNDSSSWTSRRMYTHQQKVIDDISPAIYILSECGNTIKLDGTFPEGSSFGVTARYVMSHQGYGCKWYPKQAEDHECAVTFTFLARFSILFVTYGLDHKISPCGGDAVLIYSVQPNGKVLKETVDGCRKEDVEYTQDSPGDVIIVFKRNATQYMSDGFNLGFLLTLRMEK